ncbi:DUF2087 domain-containing protein [Streptomyces abyssomicinicus]|uniref:DUF2087 domain-containing protein n=1 Tax=Streptomyces abyssomicinicus TaxID=574929 RepID=UPI001FE9D0AE|nr:DUF2087 domain-containing protein [Streptomyces abyssomicinicus]
MSPAPLDSPDLVRLLADGTRARVFAAVTLGARTAAEAAERSGLRPKEAAQVVRRLVDGGALAEGPEGLTVAYDRLREAARRPAAPAVDHGTGDAATEALLETFVRGGRLVRLPARWDRKRQVLRHIAERSFDFGVAYPERAVNDRLAAWCSQDAPVDHVTLRRYLVDLGHLERRDGVYRRPAGTSVTGLAS